MAPAVPNAPERAAVLSQILGLDLYVQRDDLLPFPLACSKVRALTAEFEAMPPGTDLIVTNGNIDSNHCRTLAIMAARLGTRVELVLHGDRQAPGAHRALSMYEDLGCGVHLVEPAGIAARLRALREANEDAGHAVHVIPGGCHTAAAAIAYRHAADEAFAQVRPATVIVASGTGAIQGGLAAAAAQLGSHGPRVVGVSVARSADRGVPPVREAARWAGAADARIEFVDAHIDGGYGVWGAPTRKAVQLAWKHGLPVDPVYSGKAFAGMISMVEDGEIGGQRVLFWHTGGLWNYIQADWPRT